jgi:hypothetical protein
MFPLHGRASFQVVTKRHLFIDAQPGAGNVFAQEAASAAGNFGELLFTAEFMKAKAQR